MGEFCMKFIANIVSFVSMIVGTLIAFVAKLTPILDESISLIAALIGLVGAIIWFLIALTKRKEGKINLDNARIDNQIKREQLKKLRE